MSEPAVPDLPPVRSARPPVVLAAVVGASIALLGVIAGITILGVVQSGINEVAVTGLATIGATLAGGFAGWIARGTLEQQDADD